MNARAGEPLAMLPLVCIYLVKLADTQHRGASLFSGEVSEAQQACGLKERDTNRP